VDLKDYLVVILNFKQIVFPIHAMLHDDLFLKTLSLLNLHLANSFMDHYIFFQCAWSSTSPPKNGIHDVRVDPTTYL